MATLETQYNNFLIQNPTSTFTFEEWGKDHDIKMKESFNNSPVLKKILEEVKTPEYKETRLRERKKYKEKLTSEYQFGFFVGEDIVTSFLPTITTDSIHTRKLIKVSEEDTTENERLHKEWLAIYEKNKDGAKSEWASYRQHSKMLETKYLPNPLVCTMPLMNIHDEAEFKKGLIDSLWDCDACTYSLKKDDIKIYDDADNLWFTIIEFIL